MKKKTFDIDRGINHSHNPGKHWRVLQNGDEFVISKTAAEWTNVFVATLLFSFN